MKRLINKLALAGIAAVIAALGVVSVSAQGDDADKAAVYNKFLACYKTRVKAEVDPCIAVGNEYMTKYGAPVPPATEPDQIATFVKNQLAKLATRTKDLDKEAAYEKLRTSLGKNTRDTVDAGKEIVRLEDKDSIKLDATLMLASVGYDAAFAATPDTAYVQDSINYAKNAIRMIESGVVSEGYKGNDGKDYPANWGMGKGYIYGSKEKALAWMNWTIAKLTVDTNKDKTRNITVLKDAMPYYYKALQFADFKKDPTLYAAVGRYYLAGLNDLVDQYAKTCQNLTEDTADCKNIREMQLGYAERGADAYAHAFKAASDDPKQPKTFKDGLYSTLTDFYKVRFKKTEGIEAYVASKSTQPLADPTSPVTPIPEPEAAPGTAPATGSAVTPPAATNGTKPPVKPVTPASTAPTKPTTIVPAKPAGSTKGAVAGKAAVKKAGR
jgi:hypothetical protein